MYFLILVFQSIWFFYFLMSTFHLLDVSHKHHITGLADFFLISLTVLLRAFSPFIFEVIIDRYTSINTCYNFVDWFLSVLKFLSFFLHLPSLLVVWLSLAVCLNFCLIFFCVFTIGFCFVVTIRLHYNNLQQSNLD